ncbi:MAG: formate dehydrogenase accessory sulfurtransferase FdhD [Nocardioidaceae bacterium]
MKRVTTRRRIVKIADGGAHSQGDSLVTEEPIEIRLQGKPLAVTMRTPGDDFDLAAGFLVSEGVVSSSDQVKSIRYCAGADVDGANTYNVLDVVLDAGVELPEFTLERNFYTTSSCGVCGKASLDAVRTTAQWRVDDDDFTVALEAFAELPDRLRSAQRLFERTGGLHAAGLFTPSGELLCVREDVGRHNAVDKVVGWAFREQRLPLRQTVLLVSGRAAFELVQKALMAGIPAMAAVSAPSSLAVELAEEAGLTLVGFLRGSSMNVYAGSHRVLVGAPA